MRLNTYLSLLTIVLLAGCDQPVPVTADTNKQPAVEETTSQEVLAKSEDKSGVPVYPEASVDMQLQQVSEHVWFVQGQAGIATDNEGFISNASVIIGEQGIVVVDALGSPSLAQLLIRKIREISDKPFLKLILTHYHADHIYGAQVFQEQGAEILAPVGADKYLDSPNALERLEERRFSLDPWVNENTRLVAPDRMLDSSEQLDIGGVNLTLSYLGTAHSDGDLSVYVEPDAVLVSGDIIFEGRVPFVGDANTREWLAILTRMEAQQMSALIPGHGAMAKKPNEVVALMRRYLQALREQMANAVEEMTSFDEAYPEADWSEFENLPAFDAANRINAYQVFLSLEAELLEE
ncbi:MAG: MBL fold metallo-hydrolase [Gammaproteobacteria bacterium]|nr:MBL fold metallo-hydrolase [Gammaproteobacteria bacterium]